MSEAAFQGSCGQGKGARALAKAKQLQILTLVSCFNDLNGVSPLVQYVFVEEENYTRWFRVEIPHDLRILISSRRYDIQPSH